MSEYSSQVKAAPDFRAQYQEVLRNLDDSQMVERLWRKDSLLWTEDEKTAQQIQASLGWLDAPAFYLELLEEIEQFTSQIQDSGYTQVVLLGMGGSSLCPEVFRRSFAPYPGFPELMVLDSTDPEAVASLDTRLQPGEALFIVSSKSGTTTETLSFFHYFWNRFGGKKASRGGFDFVAITDPKTPLEAIGRNLRFRRIFTNRDDIGGRFSSLSYFGLIPGALMGLPIRDLLEGALAATRACQNSNGFAAVLAAFMAAGERLGRDKLTLIVGEPLESLGLWIEQLVAESTGKQGKGVLPVVGEGLYPPDWYDQDRVFVFIGDHNLSETVAASLEALQSSGQPLLFQDISNPMELGGIFLVWELAVALLGSLLQINPFDQPNVQESKENTNEALREYKEEGHLKELPLLACEKGVKIYGTADESRRWPGLEPALCDFLGSSSPGDYVAFIAYLPDSEIYQKPLSKMRQLLTKRLQLATTLGYGPRYLHSTGQLHKGGPNRGLFFQITADDPLDLGIPQAGYSFGTLQQAQADGDLLALSKRQRRVQRLHIGSNKADGLEELLGALDAVTASLKSKRDTQDSALRSDSDSNK